MQKGNWDDLRFVLAVAQEGSVSAAARVLGVNHATVLRRIAAFEERHGTTIFHRTSQGYWLPPERAYLVDAARDVEAAVLALYRQLEGRQEPLAGPVRVTSTDTMCVSILPPILAEIHAAAPGLKLELLSSNARLDLARLQSEITVRPAAELPDELTGTQVADCGFFAYAAPDAPTRWIAPGPALARSAPARWIAEHVPEADIAGTADSFVSLREMAAAGLGCAILPCILGDADARLQRRDDEAPFMSVPLWVATHVDLVDAPRVRIVRDRIARALKGRSNLLHGQG